MFGVHSAVRVCSDCFNDSSRYTKEEAKISSNGANIVTDSFSRLDMNKVEESKTSSSTPGQLPVLECKCGMPLCICEAPAPAPAPSPAQPTNVRTSSAVTPHSNSRPKKADSTPKIKGSTSNNKNFGNFSLGQATNSSLEKPLMDYEVNGEGLREAIKNGDTAGVAKLLKEGVDANYCDRQGSSLLHLAAVFNQTDICFALMEQGANLECKNSQGETPLDCAPATLQYKMKMKMRER